jgi:hypothetical protein
MSRVIRSCLVVVGLFLVAAGVRTIQAYCKSEGNGPTAANPCGGTTTWSYYAPGYPCNSQCIFTVDVSGFGVPNLCSLSLASWCDGSYACWGTPSDWDSDGSSGGLVSASVASTCECGTMNGEWRAYLEGEQCSCYKSCSYYPVYVGGWTCPDC